MSDIKEMKVDVELDARGLVCPMPLLKVKKALAGMESGALLRLYATDSGSLTDFPLFCQQTGHTLLFQEAFDGEFVWVFRRK